VNFAYPELSSALGGAAAVPDLRGLFLRGYGSQSHAQNNGSTVGVTSTTHSSGALGITQGDAIRDISGKISGGLEDNVNPKGSGVFTTQAISTNEGSGAGNHHYSFQFDASRVTPTASEIRPVNTAVRYLIRAFP
jgi:hypothetical protein